MKHVCFRSKLHSPSKGLSTHLLWFKSPSHQEDKIGQYLLWLLWHWVLLTTDNITFLRLLVKEDGIRDSFFFLPRTAQSRTFELFDLRQQQPSDQFCCYLPTRTRPREFLVATNAICFATYQRKGGKEMLLFRSFQELDIMEKVITSLEGLNTTVHIL